MKKHADEIVRSAINRDPIRNACWLSGQAVHVHAIESLLDEVERLRDAVLELHQMADMDAVSDRTGTSVNELASLT